MSKSFLAACVLQLAERGQLSLDAPISTYLPYLHRPELPAQPTARMFLSNCSGLPEDNAWGDFHLDLSTPDFIAHVKNLTWATPPGLAYAYSNIGFGILGLLVEAVTGRSYREYLYAEVLDPLGLHRTRLTPEDLPAGAEVADGFSSFDGGSTWQARTPIGYGILGACGSLYSTVDDIAAWSAFLTSPAGHAASAESAADGSNTHATNAASVLTHYSRQLMQRAHTPIPSVQTRMVSPRNDYIGYGLGLVIEADSRFGTIVQHSGGLPGVSTQMRWQVESGLGVVVFSAANGSNAGALARNLLMRALETAQPPAQTVPVWDATYQAAETIDQAVQAGLSADVLASLSMLAPNVLDDEPARVRAERLRETIERLGGLMPNPAPLAERVQYAPGPAHLVWVIPCALGDVRASVELSPTRGTPVQTLEFTAVTPASAPGLVVEHYRAGC